MDGCGKVAKKGAQTGEEFDKRRQQKKREGGMMRKCGRQLIHTSTRWKREGTETVL